MKIVKLFWFVLFALALTACAAPVATSNAVTVPDALSLAIGVLITGAVTLGLQALFDSWGLDLRGVGAAIAVALSGFAVLQLQGLINLIPAQYDALTRIVLNILVVVLGGVGTLRALFHPVRAANLFIPKVK